MDGLDFRQPDVAEAPCAEIEGDSVVIHNLMRKRIGMAARLIVLVLMAPLASCQSGQSGGNATSKADVTDPNTAFSQGGAQTSTANGTTSGVSSRRGGLLRGSDADSQGR